MSTVPLAAFADSLRAETAFDVLAVARRLKSTGKDVIELQIGDSPFPSTSSAKTAGLTAITDNHTRYGPSLGLPEFRETIARSVRSEFEIPASVENIAVGPGAKPFQQFFCEVFLEPGDEVLIFTPHFPTFEPNVHRRGAVPVLVPLRPDNDFRPDPSDVAQFLATSKQPKAIFLNFPHNPTGGVATEDDLRAIADLIRGKPIAVFSDEPYCHMVWGARHHSILAQPGMLDQCVGAFTFSKSYSMSGWRLGYAVGRPDVIQAIGKMINTTLSCVPPFVQLAGRAALESDAPERDAAMQQFRQKVTKLADALRQVEGISVPTPKATFYAFPNVTAICKRLRISSQGLAMYLLEGADDAMGVACLGGESFGAAGYGYLRFACAVPDDRLVTAVRFFADAIGRSDRVAAYLAAYPKYRANWQ